MKTTVPLGLAEQAEIGAYVDSVTGAPTPVREALGVGSLSIGSALAPAVCADPTNFFNQADGFGESAPVTTDVLAQVRDFYREQGASQGAFMIVPPLLPSDWASAAACLDRTSRHGHVKLSCDTETVLSTGYGMRRSDPARASARSSRTGRTGGPTS
ncbi:MULTISPECIES: hypothetical protein [unclassified Streptomyces]|uniref:hypothetical protein n=1 Tax=unclassified Streptomyces TaxID=2593676 RepID=UPI00081D54A8|nr:MULTISPECIES: hypothetical protein [unclassified Streptomyces]SCF76105.1 hypothetical protein GA0115259_102166 [Streptomyces sp. MnatMP-M17]